MKHALHNKNKCCFCNDFTTVNFSVGKVHFPPEKFLSYGNSMASCCQAHTKSTLDLQQDLNRSAKWIKWMCSTVLNGAESTTFSLVVESIIKLILINDHARGENLNDAFSNSVLIFCGVLHFQIVGLQNVSMLITICNAFQSVKFEQISLLLDQQHDNDHHQEGSGFEYQGRRK